MTARRVATIGGMAVAAVVGLAVLALGTLWFVQRGESLPNTVVAGVDVGGRNADELRTALAPLGERRGSSPIVVALDNDEFELRPTEVGYAIDVDATVDAVLAHGRTGLPGDIVERLRGLRQRHEFALVETYDDEAVRAWVEELADGLDRDERTGSVEVDPSTLEVDVELPSGYLRIDREKALRDLRSALTIDGADRIELAADAAPQQIPDEDVLAVADQVERAVAEPFELHAGDETLTLRPNDIARIIEVRQVEGSDGATLEMVADPDNVDEVLGSVAEGRFGSEPVDAAYQADREPPVGFDVQGSTSFAPVEAPVEIVDGRPGTRFDPRIAADQLTILLQDGARAAQMRLEEIDPGFSNEDAEGLRPTHLLSTFTTYYTAGQPRSHNIQLLADTIDGTLVLPGEVFSINEVSGPRTCEKGYLEAGTIIQGELVPTCGGGTSQFGTTTFNAAFFAGVQLDQWKAHSWYISRYPMGREATLSYPELDVKFTNTTDGAILVKTAHSSSSVTVSLYGQPIASKVTATHGEPTNETDHRSTRRPASDLGPGQERVLQAGSGGFTVEVQRTVERPSGATDTDTIRTVYVPQTRIVEYGP